MDDVLDAILETLIPASADGNMPSAGSLGIAGDVRRELAAFAALLESGVAAAEEAGFDSQSADERANCLRGFEATQPGFVPTVYMTLCTLYYRHPQVLVGLGLPARPPFPEGYPLEGGDLTVFEAVVARGPIFRAG